MMEVIRDMGVFQNRWLQTGGRRTYGGRRAEIHRDLQTNCLALTGQIRHYRFGASSLLAEPAESAGSRRR